MLGKNLNKYYPTASEYSSQWITVTSYCWNEVAFIKQSDLSVTQSCKYLLIKHDNTWKYFYQDHFTSCYKHNRELFIIHIQKVHFLLHQCSIKSCMFMQNNNTRCHSSILWLNGSVLACRSGGRVSFPGRCRHAVRIHA